MSGQEKLAGESFLGLKATGQESDLCWCAVAQNSPGPRRGSCHLCQPSSGDGEVNMVWPRPGRGQIQGKKAHVAGGPSEGTRGMPGRLGKRAVLSMVPPERALCDLNNNARNNVPVMAASSDCTVPWRCAVSFAREKRQHSLQGSDPCWPPFSWCALSLPPLPALSVRGAVQRRLLFKNCPYCWPRAAGIATSSEPRPT